MFSVLLRRSFKINIQTESFALHNFNGSLVPIIGLGIWIKLGKTYTFGINSYNFPNSFLVKAKLVKTQPSWSQGGVETKFFASTCLHWLPYQITANSKNAMLERSHIFKQKALHDNFDDLTSLWEIHLMPFHSIVFRHIEFCARNFLVGVHQRRSNLFRMWPYKICKMVPHH